MAGLTRAQTIALRALVGELIMELQPASALAARIRGTPLAAAPPASLRGAPLAPAPPASLRGAPAPWDIRQELGPADRVVMLSRPLERPLAQRAQPSSDKPAGLWYSLGPAWLDYCREVLPRFERELHYRLTLDRSRLLVISSQGELEAFTREFRDVGAQHPNHVIDWRRVAASGHGGIEVAPYFGLGTGHPLTWAYSWDVPSGVVWDDAVILAAEPIQRQAPFVAHVSED